MSYSLTRTNCILGAVDETIRIWNTETYEVGRDFGEGIVIGVSGLTLHENKLYSGSGDNTIRIWNTETYEEIAILRGHTGCVNCLTLHENKLYSGSGDKIIHIWNTDTYQEIDTLRGHTGWVLCLTLHENKLYSGSGDKSIRIWAGTNTETYEDNSDFERAYKLGDLSHSSGE